MPRVVFQRPPLLDLIGRYIPFRPVFLLAAFFGLLLGVAVAQGSWIQLFAVSLVPFVLYAVLRNTMVVFLVWIGTTPILSNFIRINLGAGVPDITINRIASILLLLVLLFQIATKMRNVKPVTAVEWTMVAIVLMFLPAIFKAYDPIQSGQQIFDEIVTPFFVFFLAKNLITTKEEIKPLIWTLGFVTLYCAVLGFQEHFTEYSFFTESGKLNWQQEGMADRIQGPFDSPQVLGSVMVGGVVFFFYQIFNARTAPARVMSLVILVIHTFVTYWTYRRSVWMGYGATMVFLGMVEKRFRGPLLILCSFGVLGLIANWQVLTETSVFQERVANQRTVNDRYVIWLTSWEIIKHFPIFGSGMGWFSLYFKKYFTFFGNTVSTDYAHNIASPHNSYIRIWVEAGPITLAFYMTMLFLLILRLYNLLRGKLIHPSAGKMEVMVFIGIFITQYVQALTTDLVFHGQYSSILIFLIGGVLFQPCRKVSTGGGRAFAARIRPRR